MTFLSTLLLSNQTSSSAFYLVQSSAAQSALPVLRGTIDAQAKCNLVLVCSLYAPASLLIQQSGGSKHPSTDLKVIDWTVEVPGFVDKPVDWKVRLDEIQSAIKDSAKAVAVVIDSVDTLEDDLESPSETYKFISRILSSTTSRKDSSRLICHITNLSRVLPLLKQPRFSPTLIHLTVHPPAILAHIASAYLTPPPSSSSLPDAPDVLKFWRVFVPLAERTRDIEALIFGPDEHAEGGGPADELVVEVLVRGRGADVPVISTLPVPGSGKRKGVERLLEGWCVSKGGSVPLEELSSLRSVWRKRALVDLEAPDPAKDLTFNLSLTDTQQASRSQVPLPYEHNGRDHREQNHSAHIFYDPDSADDLDDEDPDEDLNI